MKDPINHSTGTHSGPALSKIKGYARRVCLMATLLFSAPGMALAATVHVENGDMAFIPYSVTIQPGDTVEWTWVKFTPHQSVTSGLGGIPDGLFDSGLHFYPYTFSYTYENPGEFPYFCRNNPTVMKGTVSVAGGTPTPTPAQAHPLNISTRMEVLTDAQVLIGGFIITGKDPKEVILRAIGQSLGALGIAHPLADPVLELHASDGSLITMNDNWKDTQQAEIEASGFQPQNDFESAIISTLEPGNYTAVVSGKNGVTGVGLVEGYDLDQAAASQLANVSTRGFVESGSNVMIGGFILGGGTENTTVLVRAIGPSLTAAGVAGALADPTLELHDVNGTVLRSNDNWRDAQQTEIEATGLQPADDMESAIFDTLAPGAYTAILRGANESTGVALVEAYNLP